jgi:hypothetical protein
MVPDQHLENRVAVAAATHRVQWYTATDSAMNWLRETEPHIIFVMAKKQAEELARELGIIFIHSELSDAERRNL